MMRLFIGIATSADVKEALARAVDDMQGKATALANYHMTLAFLGGREEAQLPGIQQAIQNAAAKCKPFSLTLSRLGYFGNPENALVYASVKPSKLLHQLAACLRDSLTEAGESFDDKPFVPHITLVRKVRLTERTLGVPLPEVSFSVDRITLYHSTRVEGELQYLPIFEADL